MHHDWLKSWKSQKCEKAEKRKPSAADDFESKIEAKPSAADDFKPSAADDFSKYCLNHLLQMISNHLLQMISLKNDLNHLLQMISLRIWSWNHLQQMISIIGLVQNHLLQMISKTHFSTISDIHQKSDSIIRTFSQFRLDYLGNFLGPAILNRRCMICIFLRNTRQPLDDPSTHTPRGWVLRCLKQRSAHLTLQ